MVAAVRRSSKSVPQLNARIGKDGKIRPLSSAMVAAVPPHCADLVTQVAPHYAQMWLTLAQDLDRRSRSAGE